MIINELLETENMSRYRLSKESGVPMTTITDICSGKADLDKCAAGTLFKIAKVLGITVDSILEESHKVAVDYRCSFETFKSNICHQVKDKGDLDFIIETLEADEIRKLYQRQWHPFTDAICSKSDMVNVSRLSLALKFCGEVPILRASSETLMLFRTQSTLICSDIVIIVPLSNFNFMASIIKLKVYNVNSFNAPKI